MVYTVLRYGGHQCSHWTRFRGTVSIKSLICSFSSKIFYNQRTFRPVRLKEPQLERESLEYLVLRIRGFDSWRTSWRDCNGKRRPDFRVPLLTKDLSPESHVRDLWVVVRPLKDTTNTSRRGCGIDFPSDHHQRSWNHHFGGTEGMYPELKFYTRLHACIPWSKSK